ncbi:hypothetical protein JST97_17985 [bacterium]|nr:hypothetical protein [bacterium]
MVICDYVWETDVVYGEYFNSDIAEFKRTRSEVPVRQAVRCRERALARQGITLGLFKGDGGGLLDKTRINRFFEDYQFDQMAFSPDGQLVAVGAGHQLQYIKVHENRFMPTGRLGGSPAKEARMLDLAFLDNEYCMAVSNQARMLFERGNCLSAQPLEGARVVLAGPLALQATADRMGLYRAAEWELLDEWPVCNVRALTLSASGRAAWVEDHGFHLRHNAADLEVPRKPPTSTPQELSCAGEHVFLRESETRVWHWRPGQPVWREWTEGQLIGTSADWWLVQTRDGFRSYSSASAGAPR